MHAARTRQSWAWNWRRAPSHGGAVALVAAAALAPVAFGTRAAAPAAAAQSAPTCTPASLNGSALLAGSVTVSPLPGSRDASPQTQISFLGVPAGELRVVSVVGSQTGAHRGRLLAYSQGDGASFVPSRPFAEGERVSVHARARIGRAVRPLIDGFAIAGQDAITSTPETIHPRRPERCPGLSLAPGPAPADGDGDRAISRGGARR